MIRYLFISNVCGGIVVLVVALSVLTDVRSEVLIRCVALTDRPTLVS